MTQAGPKISKVSSTSIAKTLLVASAIFVSGCAQEDALRQLPKPGEVAQENLVAHVRALYSHKELDLANNCTIDEKLVGQAKCIVFERGVVGGREIYVGGFMFACDVVPDGQCESYADPKDKS